MTSLTDYSFCVVCDNATRMQQAQQFARLHNFVLFEQPSPNHVLQLRFNADRLALYDSELNSSIDVDFIQGALAHREKFGGGKGQAIARAVGLNKPANRGRQLTVIDATAGLARDAFVLATLGCQLTLVEQSPVLVALLQDGIERALLSGDGHHAVHNFTNLVHAGSALYMEHMDADSHPDVIYIDPMYPERKKSALVKKDMQILHKLIGAAQDEQHLLETALQHATQRVVVKRPIHADPVAGIKPSTQISSKKTRYDVYVINP